MPILPAYCAPVQALLRREVLQAPATVAYCASLRQQLDAASTDAASPLTKLLQKQDPVGGRKSLLQDKPASLNVNKAPGLMTALLLVCQLLLNLTSCPPQLGATGPKISPSPPKPILRPMKHCNFSIAATPDMKALPSQRYLGEQYPNPQVQSLYEVLPELGNVVAVHLVHVPGTDKYLYMERPSGNHPNRTMFQIAGTFDIVSREWVSVDTPDGLFCCGHTLTAEGQVVIVGGHRENAGFPSGLMSVRIFDQGNDSRRLYKVNTMGWKRWYATPTLLPSGNISIIGGTQNVGAGSAVNPEYEIFDPATPSKHLPHFKVEKDYLKDVRQNYYPFTFVLPTGDVFTFCSKNSRVLNAETGEFRRTLDGSKAFVAGPLRPGPTFSQFPYTGTSIMTALTPDNDYSSVDIVVFGGTSLPANNDINLIASRLSHRMTISWFQQNKTAPWDYSFSNWVQEDMGIPRVMGDATLLPNGDVVLQNGAQTGCAGDSANGGGSRANYPTLWAQLYQPDLTPQRRYTMLSASTIPRMYHSVAALTTNGTILVAGCDRCAGGLMSDSDFINPPPVKAEYRNEIFYPPYWYDEGNKPAILTVKSNTNPSSIVNFRNGDTFSITWRNAYGNGTLVAVTAVSLVAPSAVTHSFNSNQRVVMLPVLGITSNEAGTIGNITVQIPANPAIVIPQSYMLFVMNGKTYSKARWVRVNKS